jgi:hypothetical protein
MNKNNTLILLKFASLFSYSQSVIEELLRSNENITISIMKENSTGNKEYSIKNISDKKSLIAKNKTTSKEEVLISENNKIKIIFGQERDDLWEYPARLIRESLNYLAFIERKDKGTFFENQKKYTPNFTKIIASIKILNLIFIKTKIYSNILTFIHLFIPTSRKIKSFILKNKCSKIVVVGGNWPSSEKRFCSEIDYIKAANTLNVKSVIQVVSWDNLTARGLYHYKPNIILVWNKQHAYEANKIHNIKRKNIQISGSPFMDKWFSLSSKIDTSEIFKKKLGLDANKPLITYLGSAKNITSTESIIVENLSEELKKLGIQIIVRPHPSNYMQFKSIEKRVKIIPNNGNLPDTTESKKLMIETISNSIATIGINTTAMLDSLILGSPAFAIVKPEFEKHQLSTYHFKQIIQYDLLNVVKSESEFIKILRNKSINYKKFEEKRNKFLKEFCRPNGVDKSAGSISAEIILK